MLDATKGPYLKLFVYPFSFKRPFLKNLSADRDSEVAHQIHEWQTTKRLAVQPVLGGKVTNRHAVCFKMRSSCQFVAEICGLHVQQDGVMLHTLSA